MEILVLTATLVLLSTLAPSASQEANTTFPLIYRARTAEGGEQACSADELRQGLQAITHNDISNLLRNNLPTLALAKCLCDYPSHANSKKYITFLVGVSSTDLNKHCTELTWEDSDMV